MVSAIAEMLGGGDRQLFFALEVVKETALGEPCGFANVFNAGCRVSLGADHVKGGIQDSGFRFDFDFKQSA